MSFTVEKAIKWLEKINEKIQENKQYLTKLDQPIGDGDHGINMARGFQEVVTIVNEKEYDTVSDVMKATAMTVMSKVGGASGPLYGTAFLKMSLAFKEKEVIDDATFIHGLEEALNGIKQRGRAIHGEKTLVDVWEPVVNKLKQENNFQADLILNTAKAAMEKTKETMATKGRAAYFKENSIGHIDPGSASSFYLFEALAEVLEEEK
ncbi:dihydroxyacetone kinase subunit DhaL [Pseudogracilibacillus auburnensis]|uniref:phosphoenolpyruvate--glycerone phosphotransferase n=1 Tax=Pseudogracilibacillus auburnensis TaxID=1494959 RepID=A0A2V3VVE0_9BACI|nr:dihydroxyacetone kinase subunit DhaL [Pseudogracilibacillus auburnensis]MBO1004084.1 dihydroxyacetone kinase subunit L [Pseudogracilibacillus auburnensis]PXW85626.1 dihydroxyacetone kinase DhaL subunit [Pseudogracilibacillus auburnensis]